MKLKDLLKEEQFKISNFTLLNKSVYATMEGSIGFTVKIAYNNNSNFRAAWTF